MPNPIQQKKIEKRYYFDRNYLLQYLNQKSKLKVFVDGRYLEIADDTDLADELHGVGYDNVGNPKFFDYRSIKQIKAGGELLALDQLQQQGGQQPGAEEEPEGDIQEPEGEDMAPSGEGGAAPESGIPGGEEEPEEPTKEPQRAHYDPYSIGRNIIAESMKKKPKKEINRLVRILEHPYYNVTGIITEVNEYSYEVRPLSLPGSRITVDKTNVRFL